MIGVVWALNEPDASGLGSTDPLFSTKVLEDFGEHGTRMSGCDEGWILRQRMRCCNAQVLRR
jgi:hypothetical protein